MFIVSTAIYKSCYPLLKNLLTIINEASFLPSMKYEKLYDWHVSVTITETARAILKADFDRWLKGDVPYDMIIGVANRGPTELRLGTDIALLQAAWDEDAATLKRRAQAGEGLVDCLAEQCLKGSTCEIPPSPFVTLLSYLEGNPVDVYERVKDKVDAGQYSPKQRVFRKSIIKGSGFFWAVDPLTYWLDADKNKYWSSGNRPIIDVEFHINMRTRVSKIELK